MNKLAIDKQAHLLGGWAIATTCPLAWGLYALAAVVVAAAVKEAVDRAGYGTYEARDFWATVGGGGLGLLGQLALATLAA